MKKQKIILAICIITTCIVNAQCTIIKNLDSFDFGESNVYYKDINFILNPFEGNYIYSNGSITFEIRLLKKEASTQPNVTFCEDMLIGAFKFTEGNNIVDILNSLDVYDADGTNYNIYAKSIYTGKTRGCDECGVNEKWLIGIIDDPVSGSSDELFIRKVIENGQEAIKIFIFHSLTFRRAGDPIPPPITYPVNQWFTLLKQ